MSHQAFIEYIKAMQRIYLVASQRGSALCAWRSLRDAPRVTSALPTQGTLVTSKAMKTIKTLAAALFALCTTSSAFALDVPFSATELARLPELRSSQVTYDIGLAGLTNLKIHVSHASCMHRTFTARVQEASGIFFVTVQDSSDADCRARPTLQDYTLDLPVPAGMTTRSRFVVLNPVDVQAGYSGEE